MKVHEMMTRLAISVRTDTPFRRIVHLLSEHRVSGVPVVDADGCVLGIVTESDLVLKEHRADRVRLRAPIVLVQKEQSEYQRRVEGLVAGELMTSPALTIDADADLRVGARLLSLHGIRRLPVTKRGRLVGILSRSDVLKAFFRSDGDIRAEIEGVLTDKIVAPTPNVRVDVWDGVVTLSGSVEQKSTARIITFHVDRIDGVTKVVNKLRYFLDDLELPQVMAPAVGPLEQIL